MCVLMDMWIYMGICGLWIHTCICGCVCGYMDTYVYEWKCIDVYVDGYIWVYADIWVHMCL